MKWEILKGSEKDFEGAPDWATLRTFTGGCCFFAEYGGGGAKVLDIARNDQFKSTTPFDPCGISIIAERRLIIEPDVSQQVTTEWSGDGLPPVGVECELKSEEYADFDWVKVKVVFEHNGELVVIVNMPDHGIHDCMSKHSSGYDGAKFRPIRSAEDVARDEAVKAMCGHWNLRTDLMCESIYDAIAAGKIPGVKLE